MSTPNMPTVIKLTDLIVHIADNVRVCIKCRFRNLIEYQNYFGNEVTKLPLDILNSLYVENVGVEMEFSPMGVVPTLIISASDTMAIIGIDVEQLCQQQQDLDDDDTEEIS